MILNSIFRRMMEEQERLDWSYREQEIETIQEERLELLKRMLQQREVDYQAINDKRIEHYWCVIEEQLNLSQLNCPD